MDQQAVIVNLDASNLPDEVYEKYDLATLEEQLQEVIEREKLGEYDGNEFGDRVVTLYMYGPDAEKLFAGIKPVLQAYPLAKNASVIIRKGEPSAVQREIRI